MKLIPDDPVIACIEHTGYPPWLLFASTEEIIDADFEEIHEDDAEDDLGRKDNE